MERRSLSRFSTACALVCLAGLVWLSGCARPVPPAEAPAPPKTAVADLASIPQDPAYFATGPDAGRPLFDSGLAAALYADFLDAFFKPWREDQKATPKRDLAAAFRKYAAAPGFGRDGRPNPPGFAAPIEANAVLGGYPNLSRPAVTVEAADLRALPTSAASTLDPRLPGEGYPFDYLQYSRIQPNTPLLARHVSRDGQWVYAEMTAASGWLPASAVAFVDSAFIAAFSTGKYAALTRDGVAAPLSGSAGTFRGGLGAVLPVAGEGPGGPVCLVAVRDGATAGIAKAVLPPDSATVIPATATQKSVAAAARELAGQGYGWGGIEGLRDCSLMLRDLFTPFGVWLPRNSSAQAQAGRFIPLAGLSDADKEKAIVSQAVPFASLIHLPGHIGLYLGTFEGRPVMFHNIWGVRTLSQTGAEGRRVIGKAVVTTLTPGRELPDYDQAKTIIGRVDGVTILGR